MPSATVKKKGKVPLERALSKMGIASRTQARKLIEQGQVKVNGVLRKDAGFLVVPETARFEIGDSKVAAPDRKVFLLNKPRGVITSHSDEKGRPTVFELVKELGVFLHAVGRLDFATSGLLLLTNDSKFSAYLTDPVNQIPRVYAVCVRGEFTNEKASQLMKGIREEGEFLKAENVLVRKASSRETHLIVTLHEGKNREIRRLFLALGHEVTKLKRVSFGDLELGELQPGKFREVPRAELQTLFPNFFKAGAQN
jgi:23S rRNA pseudouridine2605 synthase